MRVISRQRFSIALLAFAEDGQQEARRLEVRSKSRGRSASCPCLRPCDRQLRADDRAQPGGGRGLVKPRRAVDAVAIEQRHGRVAEIGGAIDDRFRERRALRES